MVEMKCEGNFFLVCRIYLEAVLFFSFVTLIIGSHHLTYCKHCKLPVHVRSKIVKILWDQLLLSGFWLRRVLAKRL